MRTKYTENAIHENDQFKSNQASQLDTQIRPAKQKIHRRKFSKTDKLKLLVSFDACKDASERGAFLRKEGIYYASITKWRLELDDKSQSYANIRSKKMTLAHSQVMRENATLKKKLAQAEAIIDLQKKVSELLSQHVLTQETNESSL
jgi:transposase